MKKEQRPPARPPSSAPVDGIVLAAGRSTRMGRPKPLLRVGEESFVEHAVRVLQEGGCRRITVVVSDAASETARLAEQAGSRIVVNEAAESEPIDSIRLALSVLPDDTAWVAILPVDHPLVEPGTVMRLIEAAHARGTAIVRPVYHGTAGHPGLFARRTFDTFRHPDLERGAQSVVEIFRDEVVDLPVEDRGVSADLNTPAELRRWLERDES